MADPPTPLDCAGPPPPADNPWPTISLLVGLLGAPATIVVTGVISAVFSGYLPKANPLIAMGICSLAALLFAYFGQGRWKGSRPGRIGAVLTVLWAGVFFAWSCFLVAFAPYP